MASHISPPWAQAIYDREARARDAYLASPEGETERRIFNAFMVVSRFGSITAAHKASLTLAQTEALEARLCAAGHHSYLADGVCVCCGHFNDEEG